jgi:nicotinate-nucleotide adenylyltransferase
MKTGLFFGSFNPIHIGHLILASYMTEFTDIDEVWFVVSPHNPLKDKKTLLNDYQRLEMVQLAIDKDSRFKAVDIEFKLPQPNYTIDTLTYLKEKYPKKSFTLLMGEDNLNSLHKWKNYELLLSDYRFFVYPRKNSFIKPEYASHSSVTITQAPVVEISSSFIRQAIKAGKDVQYMLPSEVNDFIERTGAFK